TGALVSLSVGLLAREEAIAPGTYPGGYFRLFFRDSLRTHVPGGKKKREEQSTCRGERPDRKAMQAHDQHLGGECAVEGRAAERMREHAAAGALKAELEDAVVRDGEGDNEDALWLFRTHGVGL